MNTLDISEKREKESWLDDVDLSCPYCKGTGKKTVRTATATCTNEKCNHKVELTYDLDEDDEPADGEEHPLPETCPKCGEDMDPDENDESESCEECSDGYFEIMYNTAYEVDVHGGREQAKLVAWEHGFLLVDLDGDDWLIAGSCGYDFTWKLQHCRLKMQGYLDSEDINDCTSHSGAHVFVGADEKREIVDYIKGRLVTPLEYERSYKEELARMDRLLKEAS